MDERILQWVGAVSVLACVTAACFLDLVVDPTSILVGVQRGGHNDLTDYFIANRNFPRFCFEQFGQWPWWNPYTLAGMPHLGNPQSALFYPPNWLFWWFDARSVSSWIMVAHHFLGGLGCYILCRKYGFCWTASVTGGGLFLGAPYLIAQTGEGHFSQICAVAWAPWAMLAYEHWRRSGGLQAPAAVLAVSFFAGHLQETYYLVVVLTALVIADVALNLRAGNRAEAWRLGAGWLGVGVLTIGLVAVELLPIWVFAGETVRSSGFDAAEAGRISASVLNVFQLLNPFALGGPQSYGGRDKFYWETLCSVGLVPLVLAIRGVSRSWRIYPVPRFFYLTLVLAAFAFGDGSAVFRVVLAVVPGMDMFRVPARMFFLCSLFVAVLAAAGMNTLGSDARTERNWVGVRVRQIFLGVMIIALIVLSVGRVRSRPLGVDTVRPPSNELRVDESHEREMLKLALQRTLGRRETWTWLLVACGIVFAADRWPHRATAASILLLLLATVELSQVATSMLAIRADGAQPFARTVLTYSGEPARAIAPQAFLDDHTAWQYGVHKAQGYEPVPLTRYHTFFQALTRDAAPISDLVGSMSIDMATHDAELLDLLNVRFVILGKDATPRDDWLLIEEGGTAVPAVPASQRRPKHDPWVFENPTVMPRAFLVGEAKQIDAMDPVRSLTELDPRHEVLLDRNAPLGTERLPFSAAKIVEYTPNRVTIDAELTDAGLLVLTDAWYPGWSAEVDGKKTQILQANVAFRAVPLAAGSHRIVFRYWPVGFTPGGVLSSGMWLVLGASMFRFGKRLKRVDSSVSSVEPAA